MSTRVLLGVRPAGRRVRLQDWHRRVLRDNARVDRGWLDDLAAAEASEFVHYKASDERLVSVEPAAVDQHQLWRQFVSPRNAE